MASWKEKLELEKESLEVGIAETGIASASFFHALTPKRRVLIVVFFLAIIPATIGARYGAEALMEQQLKDNIATAHLAYVDPETPKIGEVKILPAGDNTYSAYVEVENLNVDLSASNIFYKFNFFDAAGSVAAETSGTMYLLPDQKKYITVPRIDSTERIVRGTLTLSSITWQKQFTSAEVGLRTVAPLIYEQADPLTLVAEGSVVNNSPYRLKNVRLVFLVHGLNGQVIAISQRDEYDISAFARRAYKQFIPGVASVQVKEVEVIADTNTLDTNNLILEQAEPLDPPANSPTNKR
jgi:hypothetical protein